MDGARCQKKLAQNDDLRKVVDVIRDHRITESGAKPVLLPRLAGEPNRRVGNDVWTRRDELVGVQMVTWSFYILTGIFILRFKIGDYGIEKYRS